MPACYHYNLHANPDSIKHVHFSGLHSTNVLSNWSSFGLIKKTCAAQFVWVGGATKFLIRSNTAENPSRFATTSAREWAMRMKSLKPWFSATYTYHYIICRSSQLNHRHDELMHIKYLIQCKTPIEFHALGNVINTLNTVRPTHDAYIHGLCIINYGTSNSRIFNRILVSWVLS